MRLRYLLAGAFLASLPTILVAAERQSWLLEPAPADFQAAFESEHVKSADTWRAVVKCGVADDGTLRNCQVAGETPAGSGYGRMLLAVSSKYRRIPPDKDDAREVNIVKYGAKFDAAPDWLKKPRSEDFVGVWPKPALQRGLGGMASINCVITIQGALRDCLVLEESPPGSGFGMAAVLLAPQFTLRPARLNGVPVPSYVSLPINWKGTGYRQTEPMPTRRTAPANLAWHEAPSFADVIAAYPPKARAARAAGRVSLNCEMTSEGRLSNCEVASVSAKGLGFEAAAKALAKQFQFPINGPEEAKVARTLDVNLPITFDPAMLDGREAAVGKPAWAALPKADDLASAIADAKLATTGRVQLRCLVKPGGYVDDCAVVAESPSGVGLGSAAMKLAPQFRLTTWSTEGLPVVGGHVAIPIRFEPTAPSTPPK